MRTGIETVLGVLEANGFERLPKPLVAAGSTFDFDAVVKGTGKSHDLVIVTTTATPDTRLSQLLSGLTRALDQAQSRRPVSLVLLGEPTTDPQTSGLERHARIMSIEGNDPTEEEVRSAVAVLLPLVLPVTGTQGREPLQEVAAALGPKLSSEHQALIDQATMGADAVRDAFRDYVDSATEADATDGTRP
jgi:hypothetical protein